MTSLPESNTETDRQLKRVHTLTKLGQLRVNPDTGSDESAQKEEELVATFTAFVYTRKPTSGFLL